MECQDLQAANTRQRSTDRGGALSGATSAGSTKTNAVRSGEGLF